VEDVKARCKSANWFFIIFKEAYGTCIIQLLFLMFEFSHFHNICITLLWKIFIHNLLIHYLFLHLSWAHLLDPLLIIDSRSGLSITNYSYDYPCQQKDNCQPDKEIDQHQIGADIFWGWGFRNSNRYPNHISRQFQWNDQSCKSNL